MIMQRKYLRAREIAALTGSSIRTVRRWIADEVLPSIKLGGARLVAMEDLKAALSASWNTIQESSGNEEGESNDES